MGICVPAKQIVSYEENVTQLDIAINNEIVNSTEYQYIVGDSILNFIITYPFDVEDFLEISISEPICILDDGRNSIDFRDFSAHDKALISLNVLLWILIFIVIGVGIRKFLKKHT